jgi:hypothetical protein
MFDVQLNECLQQGLFEIRLVLHGSSVYECHESQGFCNLEDQADWASKKCSKKILGALEMNGCVSFQDRLFPCLDQQGLLLRNQL